MKCIRVAIWLLYHELRPHLMRAILMRFLFLRKMHMPQLRHFSFWRWCRSFHIWKRDRLDYSWCMICLSATNYKIWTACRRTYRYFQTSIINHASRIRCIILLNIKLYLFKDTHYNVTGILNELKWLMMYKKIMATAVRFNPHPRHHHRHKSQFDYYYTDEDNYYSNCTRCWYQQGSIGTMALCACGN